MEKIILTACGVIIIIGAILNVAFPQKEKSNAQLREIANRKGVFLVDVRTGEEFEDGHIENSVNIPLDSIEQNIDRFKEQKDIVVFCRSGRRSAQAKEILEKHGFLNVINGGSWKDVRKLIEK